MISVIKIVEDTTVDGPGFRTCIYAAGCKHKCPACHNPQSWDFASGVLMTEEELCERICSDEFADVTFSGGDPMYQAEAFAKLAAMIKKRSGKNIWCYTGFTYEAVLQNPKTAALLQYIDVLVDGRFVQQLHDPDLLFRGSSNQRLINVQQSLASGVVCLWQSPFTAPEPQWSFNKSVQQLNDSLIP